MVKSGSMLVGDMPFGTYEFDDTDIALRNAYRFIKEGGCDAVKLEVSEAWLSFLVLPCLWRNLEADFLWYFDILSHIRVAVYLEQRRPKKLWMEVVSKSE